MNKYLVQDIIDNIDKLSKGSIKFNIAGIRLDSYTLKKELRRYMLQENTDSINQIPLNLMLNSASEKLLNGAEAEAISEELAHDKIYFDARIERKSGIVLICRNNVGFSIRPDYTYKNLSRMAYNMFNLIPETKNACTMPLEIYSHAKFVNENMIENDVMLKEYFKLIYPQFFK